MIRLTPEESILLLTCRPVLSDDDRARLVRLVTPSVDWAYVLWRAETYQTVSLLRAHLAAAVPDEHIPAGIRCYVDNWSALSATRSTEQFRELGQILPMLDREGIDYHLLKGAAIAAMLYRDPLTRPMQDLDIMIRPQDARRVQRAMYAIGYRHGAFMPDTGKFRHMFRRITGKSLQNNHALHSMTKINVTAPPVEDRMLPPEWRHRQIKCAFAADGGLMMPVFVDFHVNLMAGMDQKDVWRGVATQDILGQRVNAQSITTMLWFSAVRVYREAFEYNTLKLQMLGDIDALLRIHGDAVDWAELLAIADKYQFGPPLFYVLSQARDLFGADVPKRVLALLAPDRRAKPVASDFGDVIPKILSRPIVNRFAYS